MSPRLSDIRFFPLQQAEMATLTLAYGPAGAKQAGRFWILDFGFLCASAALRLCVKICPRGVISNAEAQNCRGAGESKIQNIQNL